jgi:CspA family cold shock protein
MTVDATLPAEAPRPKSGTSYHEQMCARMCGQYGKSKRSQVCAKNGKTYDNACTARCAKVSFKRGACPDPEKKEAPGIIALDEEATRLALEAEDKRPGGEVKWFDWDKGYGAITTDDGQELYVEASQVTGDAVEALHQGDRVKFDITSGPKGLHATKVAFELTEEEKEAKVQKASLRMMEETQLQPLESTRQVAQEAKSTDGGYIIPLR